MDRKAIENLTRGDSLGDPGFSAILAYISAFFQEVYVEIGIRNMNQLLVFLLGCLTTVTGLRAPVILLIYVPKSDYMKCPPRLLKRGSIVK